MKLAIFILGLGLSTYAEAVDYSKCAKVISNLEQFNNYLISMDKKTGEVEVRKGKSSMKVEGNDVIYTDFHVESTSKNMNGVMVVTPKKLTDKEELILTYEKIEKGQAPEKLKSMTYTFKEGNVKQGGSFKIEFHEKNGMCVPEVKHLDIFSGFGKVARFFTNTLFGKITKATVGAKDIYKCRELQEELKAVESMKECMSSAPKLKKLHELTVGVALGDDKKANAKAREADIKEYEKKLNSAFQSYSVAQSALELCSFAGYKDVLEDDEYWAKVNVSMSDETGKEEATSTSR